MDLGPFQATVPPLCGEPRSQQVWVKGEVKVQAVAAVQKLVEDSITVGSLLRGFPALHAAGMVRQDV